MKKIMNFISYIFMVLGILFITFLVWFIYVGEFRITEIGQYTSPTNEYKIVFEQIGEPFLFGDSKARIILKNKKNKKIEKFSSQIANDGKKLGEENLEVNWLEEYAEVIIKSEEQEDDIHKMYYK